MSYETENKIIEAPVVTVDDFYNKEKTLIVHNYINMKPNVNNTTEPQHDAKLPVMRCLDCEFIRKMKSGKDWCVNDKSWMVGWITDVELQVCEHHVLRK